MNRGSRFVCERSQPMAVDFIVSRRDARRLQRCAQLHVGQGDQTDRDDAATSMGIHTSVIVAKATASGAMLHRPAGPSEGDLFFAAPSLRHVPPECWANRQSRGSIG